MSSPPEQTPQQPPQRFDIEIDPRIEPGVYADFASIWQTPHAFVLDFASLRQTPYLTQDERTEQPVMVMPTRIVSRVKVPIQQVFELMKALNQQLALWEEQQRRQQSEGPAQEGGGAAL